MISAVAFIIATSIPLGFLYVVYRLDLYKTGNFRNIIICFAWGIVAYEIALFVNPWMRENGLVNEDLMVRFSAPILEEIFKGLILLYLIRRPNFTYFVDGAIYGFAAGIGFAIFENCEYILGSPQTALSLAIARVLSTNLIHATGSGLIGISLGAARFDHSIRRVVTLILGTSLAMGLHIGFNNLVNTPNLSLLLVYAIGTGFGGIISIGLAIRQGLKEEKSWIMETLGETDGVTVQEKSAVEGLDKLNKILAPLEKRFGTEKAKQVREFLAIQARLGILRKTVEKLNDEKMRRAVEVQIEDLSIQMNEVRRQVGSYCMLYLRNTFLEETGTLYKRLESIMQERANTASQQGNSKTWMQAFGSKMESRSPENE